MILILLSTVDAFFVSYLLLTNKKALATDLEYLRVVLDEGYILPGNNKTQAHKFSI